MAPFQNGAILPSLEPKWGHTALPGGQYGPILSQIAKMGPYCPPWRAIWPHFDPSLPHGAKKEGEVFRMIQGGQYGPILPIATSRTRKEGGGGSNFASREGDMGTGDCKLPHGVKKGRGGNSCSREGKLGTGDSKPRMEQRRGGELTLQAMDLDFLQ